MSLTWSTLMVELLFNLGSGPVLVQTAVVHAAGIEELKLPKIKHFNHVNGNRYLFFHHRNAFTSKKNTETRRIVITYELNFLYEIRYILPSKIGILTAP
jgi:hypothetical protein